MTAPNFAALERIEELHSVLVTHQDLPPLLDFSYTAESDKVHVGLSDAAAVDAYAAAFRIRDGRGSRYLENGDETWTYLLSDDRYLFVARRVPEPLPPQGVETAENAASDRVVAS